MTPAQKAAMRSVAAANGPVAIPAATARVLSEQYGYVEADGGGWIITPAGRAHVGGESARERRKEVEGKISRDDRRWAERVTAWMKAHERIEDHTWQYTIYRYAEHVAACDHAGVEPVPTEKWADGAREWVEEETRNAAECLRDHDKESKLAHARGVSLIVEYKADGKVPRSRREAADAAATGNVVSLGTFRERRPSPGPDAA